MAGPSTASNGEGRPTGRPDPSSKLDNPMSRNLDTMGLRDVRRAAHELRAVKRRRDDAIWAAVNTYRHTLAEVAAAAGLSRQRVHQIVKDS